MAKSFKVNDKVLVISGSNKGKEAKIVSIDHKSNRACLEGILEVERHLKKSYLNPSGGKKNVHLGIDMSNLKLVESFKYAKSSEKKSDKKAKKGAK